MSSHIVKYKVNLKFNDTGHCLNEVISKSLKMHLENQQNFNSYCFNCQK